MVDQYAHNCQNIRTQNPMALPLIAYHLDCSSVSAPVQFAFLVSQWKGTRAKTHHMAAWNFSVVWEDALLPSNSLPLKLPPGGMNAGGMTAGGMAYQTLPSGLVSPPLPPPSPAASYAAPPLEARAMSRPGDEQPVFFQRHITREELIAEGNLFQAQDGHGQPAYSTPASVSYGVSADRSLLAPSASFNEQRSSSYVPAAPAPCQAATTLLGPAPYLAGQPMEYFDQIQQEVGRGPGMAYTTVPTMPVGAPYSAYS